MNRWWKSATAAGAVLVLLAAAFVLAVPGGRDAGASSPAGEQVIGTMNVDGIAGTIELRGFEFAALGGTSDGTGRAGPGSFEQLVVVKDVDVTSPSLLRKVITAEAARMVTIDLYGPDGSVVARITATNPRAAALSLVHGGAADDRLLETLEWDLTASQVRLDSGGSSFCWDVQRARTC